MSKLIDNLTHKLNHQVTSTDIKRTSYLVTILLTMLVQGNAQKINLREMMSSNTVTFSYPIITKSLSPAKFESYKHKLAANPQAKVEKPICIIGNDEQSIQWLNSQKNNLIDLSAICLIVNVDSDDQVKQIQTIAPNLMMAPISADWLNKFYGVSHYPALITKEWVAQ